MPALRQRVEQHADDAGRAFVARRLEPELLHQRPDRSPLPVTGAGRVCGTSASSEPNVTTRSTPRSARARARGSQNVFQRRFGSMPSRITASRPAPGIARVEEARSRATRACASSRPRARPAAASPGSRRSSPGRSRRTAPRPTASRDTPPPSDAPCPPSFQPRNAATSTGRRSSGVNETFSSDICQILRAFRGDRPPEPGDEADRPGEHARRRR